MYKSIIMKSILESIVLKSIVLKPIAFIVIFLFSSSTSFADEDKGSIKGTINYCDNSGVAGMQVFIPGQPYVVVTGTDGHFTLTNLPVGDYNLFFMLRGEVLEYNKWANVSADKASSLGKIDICDTENRQAKDKFDQGADGIPATPAVLSNADCSIIKNGDLVAIKNGLGICQDGEVVIKKCERGFVNCDKVASTGCETDINNDKENCGGCFNSCASSDSCNLGMC